MKQILIINGPNLNLLGKRETEIYGHESFESYLKNLILLFPEMSIQYFQSNIEGEMINKIQEGFGLDAIILNAGGYTHTSVAIADAIKAVPCPCIEVHISNIYAREEIRQTSLISAYCKGSIAGFGLTSYRLALEYIKNL